MSGSSSGLAESTRAVSGTRELELHVRPHLNRMLAVAERILGCPDAARDAVQEALVTLWQMGEMPPNLRGWLVRTVTHRSLHARRSAERRRKWEERAGVAASDSCALCDPLREVEARELRRQLEQAFAGLSSEQRLVIALRELEDMDYAAIADRLGVPIGTVRSRINRARGRLRSLMSEA